MLQSMATERVLKKLRLSHFVYALMTLCVCMAFAQPKKSNSPKTTKKANRQLTANASETKPFSKSDYVDPTFYQDLDLTEVKNKIDQSLQRISNVCTVRSLQRRITHIQTAFQNIRTLSQPYLQRSNVSISDHILLSNLMDAIHPINILYGELEITKSLVERVDLAQSFLDYYSIQHNLPDHINDEDLIDPWAKQIVKGLRCLYPS